MIGLLPFLLAAASFAFSRPVDGFLFYIAISLAGLSLVFAVVNFYLAIVRPWMYYLKNKTEDGYRFVSGLPIIGSFLSIAAILLAFGSTPITVVCAACFVLDTSGIPWSVVAVWRDKSFWDDEIKKA